MNGTSKTHEAEKSTASRRARERTPRASGHSPHQVSTANALKRAMTDLRSTLGPEEVLTLQRAIGNRAVQSIITERIERSEATDPAARLLIQAPPVGDGTIQRQPEEDEEQEPSSSHSVGLENELPQLVVDQPAPIQNQNAAAAAFNQPIGVPHNDPGLEFVHEPAAANAEGASSAGTPDISSALMLIKKLMLLKKLKQR